MLKRHENKFLYLQKSADIFVALASWFASFAFRFYFLKDGEANLELLFVKLAPILALITYYYHYKNGLYNSQRFSSRANEIIAIVKANTFTMFTFVLIIYFFAASRLSRLVLLNYFFLSTFLLILARMIIRNFLRSIRKKGKNLRHLLLVGHGPQFKNFVDTVREFKDAGLSFIGWIGSHGQADALGIKEVNLSLAEAKKKYSPDTIVVGFSNDESKKLENVLKEEYNDITQIQVLPDLSYNFVGYQVEDFAGVPLININQPSFSSTELLLKRIFDFIVTLIGIIFISPLLFLIALMVKLTSKGPIFYGQERTGLDGHNFTMWKFRTMKLAVKNEDKEEWSNKENPRKTKIGSMLRKTSLDELPQLWNVLKGEMSLVGPRPERPYFVDKFRKEIPAYMLRHKMKAGITGWAQINGWRGDTCLHKRIEFDISYIKNWSFLFDLKIIFLTFWKGFINKNAY